MRPTAHINCYRYMGPLNHTQDKSDNAGIRAVRACRMPSSGMHGTYPAGGEDIDVFIELRVLGIRLMIMTDEVVIVIDIP